MGMNGFQELEETSRLKRRVHELESALRLIVKGASNKSELDKLLTLKEIEHIAINAIERHIA